MLVSKVLVLNCSLSGNLVDQVMSLPIFLGPNTIDFALNLLFRLLWSKVSFVENSLQLSHLLFLFPVFHNLLSESFLIIDVILFFEKLIMTCDDILLLFLPAKLLFFEVSDILYFFTFLHEPLMSLLIDFL